MKPILFNTEMVRRLLNGTKTVTRRVVKGYAMDHLELDTDGSIIGVYNQDEGRVFPVMDYAPYRPGDILYVRETFDNKPVSPGGHFRPSGVWYYKADGDIRPEAWRGPWRPSIHMPREAARIFLRVTDVRVERLHTQFFNHSAAIFSLQEEGVDIGNHCQGCISFYGCPCCIDEESECGELDYVRDKFANLWDSTIKLKDRALYGWEANPWVWAIEFERAGREEAEQHGN